MAKTCSCWLKICLLQNHRPQTGHRQLTTDTETGCPLPINHRPPTHQQVLNRHTDSRTGPPSTHRPPTHQQVIHRHTDSATGPPPTHWLTNRLSTDPPTTHRVNWPPTIWLNQTYFNRGRLLVVGGLSVVGGFVIHHEIFKEHWNQVSLSF